MASRFALFAARACFVSALRRLRDVLPSLVGGVCTRFAIVIRFFDVVVVLDGVAAVVVDDDDDATATAVAVAAAVAVAGSWVGVPTAAAR